VGSDHGTRIVSGLQEAGDQHRFPVADDRSLGLQTDVGGVLVFDVVVGPSAAPAGLLGQA
jgi:hypothetical protein